MEEDIIPQPEQQGTSLGTYLDVYNPTMFQIRHPEFRFKKEMIDPTFSWSKPENKKYLDSLPIKDMERVLEARSLDHANLLLQKNKLVDDGEQSIQQNDPWWVSTPLTLVAGSLDASMLIPGSFAFKAFKGANAIGRYSNAFLRTGTAGAVGGVAYEAEKDIQGLDANYTTAAAYGFFLGGGLGIGMEAFGRAAYKQKLADSLGTPEIENALNQDNFITINYVDGSNVPKYKWNTTDTVGKIPRVNSFMFPEFMKSDVSILYEADSNEVRNFVASQFSPSSATRDANGVPIPVGITAEDKSNKWKGIIQTARFNIGMIHRDAVVAGYKGTVDEFNNEVGMYLRQAMAEQEKAAYAYANSFDDYYAKPGSKTYTKAEEEFTKPGSTQTEFTIPTLKNPDKSKLFKERVDKYYADNPVTIKSGNPHIDKAVKEHMNYYKKILETGKKLGIKELKDINISKLYVPRVYDWSKIRQTDAVTLENTLKRALEAHPANTQLTQSTEYDTVVKDLVKQFQSIDKATEFVDFSYIVPTDLPMMQYLKSKKLKLDDGIMSDLLINDADTVMGLYHYKQDKMMRSQYAFGSTNKQEIEDKILKPLRDSLSPEELSKVTVALENVFRDTLGTLRIPKNGNSLGWQTSRMLSQFNALTYGGGFGLNTIADIPVALMATESKAMFMQNFFPLIKGVHNLLFKGEKANLEFMNELIAMGNLQNVFSIKGANRVLDTENVFNAGWLEHKMMGLNDFMFKFNGLRGITTMLEAMVGGNAVMDIRKLGKLTQLSDKQQARLTRWGLSHEEAKRMSNLIDTNATFEGNTLKQLNIHKWAEGDMDVLQTAITRAIHSGVVQGDTVHLPRWMIIPDAIRKLAFQFLRVPIAAHEILLRRGWTEDKAGLAVGALGSIMAYATVTYLREQAAIAAGFKDKADAKYDIMSGDEEAWIRLLSKSTNYAAQLGAFTTGLSYTAALSGQPEIGREYANDPTSVLGPSIGRLGQVRDIVKPLLEGKADDTKQAFAVKNMIPFANIPVISEGLNEIIKENTYSY